MTPRQPTEGADPTHLASRMGVPGGVEAAGALPVTDAIQLNHAAIELAAVAGDEGQVRALVNALEHDVSPWRGVNPWRLLEAATARLARRT